MNPGPKHCSMHMDEPALHPEAVPSETADYLYTCELTTGHAAPGPYCWPVVLPPAPQPAAPKHPAPDVDVKVALEAAIALASMENGGGFVEYGLIERAYALANPKDWRLLVDRYDHRYYYRDDEDREKLSYTASKYLARHLSLLRSKGHFAFKRGPGTGYWAYDNPISHYSPSGTAADAHTCSWAASGYQMSDYMPSGDPG